MKGFNKILLVSLTFSLVVGGLCSTGSAENYFGRDDPTMHGWNAVDLLICRPLGLVAGAVGSAVFVVSLPFTIPSGGVRDSADMFIVKPFHFSFIRRFPDQD